MSLKVGNVYIRHIADYIIILLYSFVAVYKSAKIDKKHSQFFHDLHPRLCKCIPLKIQ